MIRLLAAFCIVCGCLFVYGFLTAERVRISVHKAAHVTDLDVIVTVPSVPKADTLFLSACAAEMDENSHMFCTDDGWEITSAHPMREDQRQYPFLLRNVPRGWLMFSAEVVDHQRHTVASGETRMVR